jgi:hypothetical protein
MKLVMRATSRASERRDGPWVCCEKHLYHCAANKFDSSHTRAAKKFGLVPMLIPVKVLTHINPALKENPENGEALYAEMWARLIKGEV